MSITLNILQPWEGYILPHLLPLGHENYREPDFFPEYIDWKRGTRGVSLSVKTIDVKFLRIAKRYVLTHYPDIDEDTNQYIRVTKEIDSVTTEVEVPVVLEIYDYLPWIDGLPSKQEKRAYFFRGDLQEDGTTSLSLDLNGVYKLIPRNKVSAEDKENIVVNRRRSAVSFLKGRAKEIATAIRVKDPGAADALNIEQAIPNFFNNFFTPLEIYIKSGENSIIDQVNDSAEAFLNISLPELGTIREEITRILQGALDLPTQADINAAIAATYAEGAD